MREEIYLDSTTIFLAIPTRIPLPGYSQVPEIHRIHREVDGRCIRIQHLYPWIRRLSLLVGLEGGSAEGDLASQEMPETP